IYDSPALSRPDGDCKILSLGDFLRSDWKFEFTEMVGFREGKKTLDIIDEGGKLGNRSSSYLFHRKSVKALGRNLVPVLPLKIGCNAFFGSFGEFRLSVS